MSDHEEPPISLGPMPNRDEFFNYMNLNDLERLLQKPYWEIKTKARCHKLRSWHRQTAKILRQKEKLRCFKLLMNDMNQISPFFGPRYHFQTTEQRQMEEYELGAPTDGLKVMECEFGAQAEDPTVSAHKNGTLIDGLLVANF
jgi:hypothetical protein